MWAFAAAVTITLHRYPDRPVWHLRIGIAVFAAFGAGLNYVHGLTVPPFPHMPTGPVTGGIMAAVSVAGVTAHQLVTAFGSDADGMPPASIRTEIEAVREALDASVRALWERHDTTAASLDETVRAMQEAFRTESAAVREALRTQTDAVRAAVRTDIETVRERHDTTAAHLDDAIGGMQAEFRTQIQAVRERHDTTAASLADTIRGAQEASRTEIEAVRETLTQIETPSSDPGKPLAADRAALVTELADEIRDAISSGERWKPDYAALMARTGYLRSWCEKAVRDARTEAFSAPHQTRTGNGTHPRPAPYAGTARTDGTPDTAAEAA
jgi:hypothetical protein